MTKEFKVSLTSSTVLCGILTSNSTFCGVYGDLDTSVAEVGSLTITKLFSDSTYTYVT